MILKELTNDEFKKFSNEFYIKSIYQTVEYAFIMSNQGYDCIFLGLCDDDKVLAASLFLIDKNTKYKYAYAPRGFLIDYNNFNLLEIYTKEIKNYFSRHQIVGVKISPYIIKTVNDLKYKVVTKNNYYNNIFSNLKKLGFHHLGYNQYFEALKPRYEAIIDLNVPYYILFNNINKQFRTKIRAATKNGVKVYKGNINNLNYLYLQTHKKYPRDLKYFEDSYKYWNTSSNVEFFYTKLDTKQYLKTAQKSLQEEEQRVNLLNIKIRDSHNNSKSLINKKMEADRLVAKYRSQLVQATKLLTKYPDGIITSSAMIIKNGEEVHMLIDGYDPKYKILNSKHLLIWTLCERYSKQGFKKFNLGGITDINVKNNPYQGLNDFKLKFNALAIEYMGDLELVTNNTLHFIQKNSNILKR